MSAAEKSFDYRVIVETEMVELTSTLLSTYTNPSGTELVDGEVAAGSTTGELREVPGRVVAYYRRFESDYASELRRQVAESLQQLESDAWELVACDRFEDENWREQWKDHFRPLQLSPTVAVGPPWRADELPDSDDRISLIVEPGMAFGTGDHETTKLAARSLESHISDRSQPAVLDVGCGSGILAMAAARLGARPVVGLDIDEEAVDAARDNLERNDLSGRVSYARKSPSDLDRRFDLVVANMLAPTLLELRDALLGSVAPGGGLLLSGVTLERADSFLRTFLPEGWRVESRRELGEWTGWTVARIER